tara:strand:- start:966 stop:1277 length:312 start_codon:yes stop_codon:yes gene_type:complete
MKRGANALLHGLESSTIDLKNPITTMTDVADIISSSMGGTSGALFEIFFRVCGRTIMEKSSSSNDAADANAFSAGFVAGGERAKRASLEKDSSDGSSSDGSPK